MSEIRRPTSRTHPWAMYRKGHLFQWSTNDVAESTEPATSTETTDEKPRSPK